MGIETTTGPLGQGIANAVGMALAEKMLAAEFNRPGLPLVDHRTWVFAGDGCLMEGISHEACSLAGTLQLAKLTLFYDDNGISIDGKVQGWFADDTSRRFEAYGWPVRPSLISCKTVIGWGAPHKAGTKETHGEALGAEEVAATRVALGWSAPPFVVPPELAAAWNGVQAGRAAEAHWQELYARYRAAFPDLAAGYERRMRAELPHDWASACAAVLAAAQAVTAAQATRQSSQATLNLLGPKLPELFGGSADLTPSNGTLRKDSHAITAADASGNYLHYGVREFGMTAAMTGIALHGGFVPYGGTFLVFSDYARNAVRMAALMHQRVVLVYTHDSIALGEDGPTHQPIEHLNALRLIPNLTPWRPADALETAVAWCEAIEPEH